MTEKYVKLSDIGASLNRCASTTGPTADLTGKIVTRSWFYDLPTVDIDLDEKNGSENESAKDASAPCPYYRTNECLSYGADGVPEVKVVGYCLRKKDDVKASDKTSDTCCCAGRKIACPYSAQTRREGIYEEMSDDEKERMYWIRTHMTSISRYLHNNNPKHTEEYRQLAKTAAKSILRIVNGGVWDDEEE